MQKKKFLFFFIVFLLIVLLFVSPIKTLVLVGNSMAPTFKEGQRLFYSSVAYCIPNILKKEEPFIWQNPKINDIIILKEGGNPRLLVKRILATSQDSISIANDQLIIGDSVKIPLTQEEGIQLSKLQYIPENFFFVIGDNKEESRDSRTFGLIPFNAIQGKVLTARKRSEQ